MKLKTDNGNRPCSMITKNCQLSADEIARISGFVERFPQIDRVILFGSRAMGNAKQGSDLDLAIAGIQVNDTVISKIRDYLEEQTNLPYLMDLVHYEKIANQALREHIDTHGKTIYKKKSVT